MSADKDRNKNMVKNFKQCFHCGATYSEKNMKDYHKFWLCHYCNSPRTIAKSFGKYFINKQQDD